ncbi:MAG TPA: transcription-repair coupling factor [Terriglobales bacterium]|nr:transcription-repair coupling factor [Terriglobales bacterium]
MILPFVRQLFADVEKLDALARAIPHLRAGAGRIRVAGLVPTAKALYLVLLQHRLMRPLVTVVGNNRAAEDLAPVLRAFCELTGAAEPQSVLVLPAYDVLPYDNLSPHPEIQEQRAATLWKIASGEAAIVVAPVAAVAMRLRAAEYYAGLGRVLRRGEELDVQALVGHLNEVGYAPADLVEMPGEYALRGGILDVYSPEADRPVRVEFFGDEIESIRKFEPASQRSSNPIDAALLLPLTETPVRQEMLAAIHARLSGKRVAGAGAAVQEALAVAGVTVFPGWEMYAPLAGSEGTLLDLLPASVVMLDEPSETRAQLDHWWERVQSAHERSGVGRLAPPEDLYLPPEQLLSRLESRPGGALEHLGIEASDAALQVSLLSQPAPRFHGSIPLMIEEAQRLTTQGQRVIFAAPNAGEVERLAEVLAEYGLPYRLGFRTGSGSDTWLEETGYLAEDITTTTIVKALIPEGVVLPGAALALFGARDLFDESETVIAQPIRRKSKVSAFLSDFRDLAVGDYVVHVEHGIGRYLGLKEITHGDFSGEFMVLEYAEGAKLYVPLTRLDLVQKYRSAEGARPPLARLGSAAWTRTKARVKKAMQDMADELLKLYAQRRAAAGHAFPPDSEWQREFEEAFEHSETEDQEQAIVDVKRDMESSQPMDRLLCGDVGYGKTEVAMRAAFKAVGDNKQVVVLAPTTVLVFQHYETFRQRFAAFPITIEMLSRFRTARQQKEILARIEAGKVDIVIGTHRLLSRDVHFPNLGLVIVDEEQRFGVRHKERLKQLKKEVDVLTLSATPIPRTLHMSLVGLRDMSVIETPPRDRMAIQTVVAAFDEQLIRTAIEHELERGGQVYFVHNRVDTIYEMAARIQELAPRARVLVGHGQMSENELEKVMLRFMRHEADVLVSTTIIENGLDIPLCNTIVIHRADRFGLAELYQLRGRVGRSNRRAYAYLLIPGADELTPVARRRLAALKEFSDLGAGFKLAALDLELRGAGNLLGAEQSGHIEAVGFELYTRMLETTVRELQGQEAPRAPAETQINLGLPIRIPPEYIPDENQRLRMYKRVAGVESESQLADVRAELADRYGPPPPAVGYLLDYAALRLLAAAQGVTMIDRRRNEVQVHFSPAASIDPARLARFVAGETGAQFTPAGVLKFSLKSTQAADVLARLKELLLHLAPAEAVPGAARGTLAATEKA